MDEHLKRLTALSSLLAEAGNRTDTLLVSAPSNVRYLSGFTGSNGLLIVSRRGAVLLTDPRYSTQAEAESAVPVKVVEGPLASAAAAILRQRRVKRVAFERNRLSFETWDDLRSRLNPVELIPLDGLVERLRMKKSPSEICQIRQSVETNSRAFRRALKSFRPEMRESELAAEIDYQMRRGGAQAPAFETIVAAGVRSALPHARPTHAKIGARTPLLIDMGALEAGYASDMSRTLHVGKSAKRFRHIYQLVKEAQEAAIDAVRPGAKVADVDRAARAIFEAAGFEANFVHSTGHGVGLEIHEPPRVGKKSEAVLDPGFVITVEPGLYFDDWGGIRIEDMVLVTDSGREVLTPTSKDLVEL